MTPIRLLDGGLGTSLEDIFHVNYDASTPLWSPHLLLESQDTLLKCQKQFGEIPVDVILTCTYQVSKDGSSQTRSASYPSGVKEDDIPGFLCAAIDIAGASKHGAAKIALSLGPYGACVSPNAEYTGDYDAVHDSLDALQAWHSDWLGLFASIDEILSRISYVVFETIPRLDEIIAIRRAMASSVLKDIPFWISCLFPHGNSHKIPHGSTAELAVEAMLDQSDIGAIPFAVGINCTNVTKMAALTRAYEETVEGLLSAGRTTTRPSLVLCPDGTMSESFNAETGLWEANAAPAGEVRRLKTNRVAPVLTKLLELGVNSGYNGCRCRESRQVDSNICRRLLQGNSLSHQMPETSAAERARIQRLPVMLLWVQSRALGRSKL